MEQKLKKNLIYGVVAFIVTLSIGILTMFPITHADNPDLKKIYVDSELRSIEYNYTEYPIADCLRRNNVILYTSALCSHCQTQKEKFGDTYSLLNVVEVSDGQKLISDYWLDKGIKATPTWYINNKEILGVKDVEYLAKEAGCLNEPWQ